MIDRMAEILLGHLPEAIYFAVFLIFAKKLKTKRIIFLTGAVIEYLLMFNIIRYSLWSHILFFISMYLWLKVLYKDETQIIDVLTLGIASLFIVFINIPLYLVVNLFTNSYLLFVILERLILFILLFCIRNRLYIIQDIYKKLWNRNDKVPKKIKTTTFRALNTVVFNIMFYILNACLIFAMYNW